MHRTRQGKAGCSFSRGHRRPHRPGREKAAQGRRGSSEAAAASPSGLPADGQTALQGRATSRQHRTRPFKGKSLSEHSPLSAPQAERKLGLLGPPGCQARHVAPCRAQQTSALPAPGPPEATRPPSAHAGGGCSTDSPAGPALRLNQRLPAQHPQAPPFPNSSLPAKAEHRAFCQAFLLEREVSSPDSRTVQPEP